MSHAIIGHRSIIFLTALPIVLTGCNALSPSETKKARDAVTTGTIYALDATTSPPTLIATMEVDPGPYGVAIPPDGRIGYGATCAGMAVFSTDPSDPNDNQLLVSRRFLGEPEWFVFRDNSRGYATLEAGSAVAVFDTVSHQVIAQTAVDANPEEDIIAGTHLYVSSEGGSDLNVIDIAPGSLTENQPIGDPIALPGRMFIDHPSPEGLAVVERGGDWDIYVTDEWKRDNVVWKITDSTRAITGPISTRGDKPEHAAYNPLRSEIYVTNTYGDPSLGINGSVAVIDTTNDTLSGDPIAMPTSVSGLAFTPDGTAAYVVGEGQLYIIDTATRSFTSIALDVSTGAVAFTPDGARVYVTSGRPFLCSSG